MAETVLLAFGTDESSRTPLSRTPQNNARLDCGRDGHAQRRFYLAGRGFGLRVGRHNVGHRPLQGIDEHRYELRVDEDTEAT